MRKFVSNEDIAVFNDNLEEDIEKINKYNKELKRYNTIGLMGVDLDILISNDGEMKANNIYVEIKFPKSVLVLSVNKEKFKKPNKPSLTENPIKKAEKQRNAITVHYLDGITKLMESPNSNIVMGDNFSLTGHLISDTFYSSNNKNMITVYCKELIQTRKRKCIESYTLVPVKSGEFEIKVSVICEQYSKRDEFTIPLVISEQL
ncbi:hypothetical protein [Bacillus sp. OV166]|uniref:hypothetical protein n=1 Tax=Bacillus sp. OV166 TaxID=1882763 RepID=UPI001C50231B|nr:hypothetical protein [Bacillus sp. OV166]